MRPLGQSTRYAFGTRPSGEPVSEWREAVVVGVVERDPCAPCSRNYLWVEVAAEREFVFIQGLMLTTQAGGEVRR